MNAQDFSRHTGVLILLFSLPLFLTALAFSWPLSARAMSLADVPPQAYEVLSAFSVAQQNGGKETSDPELIKNVAFAAYVWGVAPEFVYRWSQYQQLITSPVNSLTYGRNPPAWNNPGNINAGNASVYYLNAVLDLSSSELVLTIPPSLPPNYFVAQFFDNFINTTSVIGSRTTPTDVNASYLVVGPKSPYAKLQKIRLKGQELRVIALDTPHGNLTIRVKTNPLAPPPDPYSNPMIYASVVKNFALNPLRDFLKNKGPLYPTSYLLPSRSEEVRMAAKPWANTPTTALGFFNHVALSLAINPFPTRTTGLSGTPIEKLPTWVVPQSHPNATYFAPSFGQQPTWTLFKTIGLGSRSFKPPSFWGDKQLTALEEGFKSGVLAINQLVATAHASTSSNYWQYLTDNIGTYANNPIGYLYRAVAVTAGGFANLPEDAVYAQINTTDGSDVLDGNNTYALTFKVPEASYSSMPISGIFPPLKLGKDGKPSGFWSLVLYQPDTSQSSAPFISQVSTTNTSYTRPDTGNAPTRVLSCNEDNSLTAEPSSWTTLVISTPIVIGANAGSCGLRSGLPYFIASTPTVNPQTGALTFKLSTQWQDDLEGGTPIPNSGKPGLIANITPANRGLPNYAALQPVSQLGSMQIEADQLQSNPDGSYTLWMGPPQIVDGLWAPPIIPNAYRPINASNWIPTPSTAYLESIYGKDHTFNTTIRPMIRIYDPQPAIQPPSILPCLAGSSPLCQTDQPNTYVFPRLIPVVKAD